MNDKTYKFISINNIQLLRDIFRISPNINAQSPISIRNEKTYEHMSIGKKILSLNLNFLFSFKN